MNDTRDTTGNPAPLGLLGFGMTTVLLNFHNAGFFELNTMIQPGATRRNVTTRGIRLDSLVGTRFRIGTVICQGTRICEPCQYLVDLLGQPILQGLVHRGGLRANILTEGYIRIGDGVAIDRSLGWMGNAQRIDREPG